MRLPLVIDQRTAVRTDCPRDPAAPPRPSDGAADGSRRSPREAHWARWADSHGVPAPTGPFSPLSGEREVTSAARTLDALRALGSGGLCAVLGLGCHIRAEAALGSALAQHA
jgi:hypothetical protein